MQRTAELLLRLKKTAETREQIRLHLVDGRVQHGFVAEITLSGLSLRHGLAQNMTGPTTRVYRFGEIRRLSFLGNNCSRRRYACSRARGKKRD